MDYKKSNAPRNTITLDRNELVKDSGNVYEAISIMAQRANQISEDIREELQAKLAEFATNTESLEEVFENKEQIEVSRFYERLPKPHAMALAEWLEDKIYHRKPEVIEEEAPKEA